MVDMEMGAENIIYLVVSDAERKQLVAPALLAGKIERRRMTLVLAGAGIHQDRVAWRADHEGLVGDHHHSQRLVEHLRLHRRQVTLEDGLIIGREEILRPPPRPFALNHRVNGDVPDPDLSHLVPPIFRQPNGRRLARKLYSASRRPKPSAKVRGVPKLGLGKKAGQMKSGGI